MDFPVMLLPLSFYGGVQPYPLLSGRFKTCARAQKTLGISQQE